VPDEKPALTRAALLGLGGGLRSFAPPVALALHDRGPLAGPARFIAFAAAAGELIADKQPDMSSRLSPRGLTLRLGFSGIGGHALAGWQGAGLSSGLALAAAVVGSQLRTLVRGRRSQLVAALIEDSISYALVLASTARA
jgi:uncharacterized membrane protein